MPLYEYTCASCGRRFDALVPAGAGTPECPTCGAAGARREISLFAAGSGTRAVAGCGCGGACACGR